MGELVVLNLPDPGLEIGRAVSVQPSLQREIVGRLYPSPLDCPAGATLRAESLGGARSEKMIEGK